MAENPYSELPGADLRQGPPAGTPVGNLEGLLDDTWERFKQHWLGLSLLGAVWFGLALFIGYAGGLAEALLTAAAGFDDAWVEALIRDPAGAPGASLAGFLLIKGFFYISNSVLGTAGVVWVYPMLLGVARGGAPDITLLTAAADRVPIALATLLVMQVLTSLGMLACLIPGWILIYGLILTGFVAVDTQLGIQDSLRYAWRLMSGHRLHYFGLSLVAGLALLMAALFTCGLGFFPGISCTLLMTALAYVRLSGRAEPGLADPVLD